MKEGEVDKERGERGRDENLIQGNIFAWSHVKQVSLFQEDI